MQATSKQASVRGGSTKKPKTGAGETGTVPADKAEEFLQQMDGAALYAEGLNQIKELQNEIKELQKELRERPSAETLIIRHLSQELHALHKTHDE